MSTEKKTRHARSISICRKTYDKLKAFAEANNTSMAAIVEMEIERALMDAEMLASPEMTHANEPPKDFVIVLGSALSIDRDGGKLVFKSRELVYEMSPEHLERIGLDCIRQANEARYWRDRADRPVGPLGGETHGDD